jgi:ribosomal-protein-alanine N-acetyltransferase
MQRTTQRIILCAATIELLEAELTSLASLGRLLNATIPSGWPPGEYDRKAQEFFLERMREGFDQPAGWYSWYAIHPNAGSHTLIGAAGFIGPPDKEGLVQIGFSIHPHWQRLGFATELAAELVAFAFEHDSVRSIIHWAVSVSLKLKETEVTKRFGSFFVGHRHLSNQRLPDYVLARQDFVGAGPPGGKARRVFDNLIKHEECAG